MILCNFLLFMSSNSAGRSNLNAQWLLAQPRFITYFILSNMKSSTCGSAQTSSLSYRTLIFCNYEFYHNSMVDQRKSLSICFILMELIRGGVVICVWGSLEGLYLT